MAGLLLPRWLIGTSAKIHTVSFSICVIDSVKSYMSLIEFHSYLDSGSSYSFTDFIIHTHERQILDFSLVNSCNHFHFHGRGQGRNCPFVITKLVTILSVREFSFDLNCVIALEYSPFIMPECTGFRLIDQRTDV